MSESRAAQIVGCLLGGALGDAVGNYFSDPSRISASHAAPAVLHVSDDTQLTLATCEAIPASGMVSPAGIAARFCAWYRARRLTGLGSSTLKALTELDAGGHWATTGTTGERSAGNGAAMRCAPLAFFLDPDTAGDRQTIRDVCRITHRHEEAYIGALAIIRSIRHALAGKAQEQLLGHLIQSLPDSCVRDRLIEVSASRPSIREYAEQFGSSGYVVDSVPLAIVAAIRGDTLLDTMGQLVEQGGDTDTIASLFGQIFGARHGVGGLPWDWIERIDGFDLVWRVAETWLGPNGLAAGRGRGII